MQVHIDRNGERYGPYSIEDINAYLANGILLPTDLAWQDGMTEWVPISQIPGVTMPGDSVATPIPPSQPVPDGNKKKILIGIGAGMGLLALMAGIWFLFIRGAGGKEQLSNNDGSNSSAAKPDKELTIEEKVIGEYEIKLDGDNYRIVFLENGKMFHFVNGEKDKTEGTWRVVGKEVHGVGTEKAAYKIDPNGDLTSIAEIDKDGKRKEIPKEHQMTLKKIKSESKGTSSTKPIKVVGENKKLKDEIIGAYESRTPYGTVSYVFRSNGIVSYYHDGDRIDDFKWSIVGNEIHTVIDNKLDQGFIYIKNPDNGLTQIAAFDKGERLEAGPTIGTTWKRIKHNQPIGLPPSKGDDNNSTTSKPADDTNATKLTPEERKVVGEYERKTDSGYTKRLVFLDNGVFEGYGNSKKREGGKWAISKDGEIHITNPDGDIIVSRINKDRSLTVIVLIDENGKREDFSREQQETYKKLK